MNGGLTMKPLQRKPYNSFWVTLCAYGPWALTAIGLYLLIRGGTA